QPVYGSTERLKQFSLDSKGIQKLQDSALKIILSDVQETFPEYILQKFNFIGKQQAIRFIHFPSDAAALQQATKRLKFEELFFIQLKLLRNRQLRTQKFKGQVFDKVGSKFNVFYNEI